MQHAKIIPLSLYQVQANQAYASLRRPRLLARAAKAAAALWKEDRDLPRALRGAPEAGSVQERLRAAESVLEHARRSGHAPYDAGQHILVLAALLQPRATLHRDYFPLNKEPNTPRTSA